MKFEKLQKNWDELGKTDPLWAILTWPNKKRGKWEKQEFFKTGIEEIEHIIKYLNSLDVNISRKKALDFGCGVGRLTQALANHFDEVYGIDIAPSMIRLAREYNRQENKCRYYLNNKDNLEIFSSNSFDFICSFLTFQHMKPEYTYNYLKEFLRILSPGGIIIFQQVENPGGKVRVENILKLIIKKLLNIFGISSFEMHGIKKENLIKFLKENNSKIIDIKGEFCSGWTNFQYCITKGK